MIRRYLDDIGDGTGEKNANGNYSVSSKTFLIAPGESDQYCIYRLFVSVEDTGMQWEKYGGLVALTNGIIVRKSDSQGVEHDLTDGVPVKSNAHWGNNCFDAELKTAGAGNDFFQARWTFTKAGAPISLNGWTGDKLEIVLNDDFSGLIAHYFKVEGIAKPK